MNYRKTLAVSLAALAAAGLIAGCGGEKPAASKAAGSASNDHQSRRLPRSA